MGKSEENKTSKVTVSNPAFNKDEVLSSVQSGSEIEILCDKADDRGLRNYVMDHMKKRVALQKEWFVAVFKAPVAAKLVMNALEPPFYWGRKACTGLLENLYRIFGKDDSCFFASDVKDSAREVAKAWKDKMNLKDNTSRSGRANVFAFLKLLASFKIAADYERNELWGLLLAVSRNGQNLVRCLGLSPNVSEFIDMLSKDGQQVEALRYANAFGMLDKINHVDLLTSYLRDVEMAGKEVVTNAQGTAASQAPDYMARLQRDEDIKLRAAMRDVIELLGRYGLDSHFFEDKLRKLEQGKEAEEQPEPRTRGKNNESKTSKVTVLNPGFPNLEQEEKDRFKNSMNATRNRTRAAMKNAKQEEDGKKAAEKKVQEKEDGNKGAKKKAENVEEKEDGKKASEKKAQEIEEREDGKKAAEKKAQEMEEKEDGKKAAEKRAQEKEKKEGGKKDTEKKAQEREDGKKDAGKKAQEKAGKKIDEKKAQEKEEQEDGKKNDAEKKAQHKRHQCFETGYKLSESENYASKRAKHASSKETTRVVKQKGEHEDGKKVSEKKAQEKEEEEDGKNAAEKNAQENEDGKKAAEKKAQVKEEKEHGKKAAEKKAQVKEEREVEKNVAENKAQHKRHQSFQPGYGLSERENYASKRAKETTRVVGGMDSSKPLPYNIDGVQYNYGLIGHDHHPSASSAANTGLAAGAFASVPSIGAQINNERRRHEGNPLVGTGNLAPIGSSLYRASVPASPFAVPLSNVAAVNYDGRGQQSYVMNFVEVDKNHVRTSVYGTRDLSNKLAMQNNYNFEGRGEESYKLNFGEIHNNPVRASSYVTGVSKNPSATQCYYERRVPELYTSTFGCDNTAGIGSSVYESNPCTIPSSVNQGSHKRSLGQSSSFAGRNAVTVESSGYGSGVPTVPPSSVSQGHFERRGSVINKYTFNSG